MTQAEAIDKIIRSGDWNRSQILALLSERARFGVPPDAVTPDAVEEVEAGCGVPLNHVRSCLGMAASDLDPDRLESALDAPDEPVAAPESIVAAIRKLDSSDSTLWTKSGVPRVDAIEAVLGRDITMAERNAAWESVLRG